MSGCKDLTAADQLLQWWIFQRAYREEPKVGYAEGMGMEKGVHRVWAIPPKKGRFVYVPEALLGTEDTAGMPGPR